MLLTAIILTYSTVIQAKPWIFGHSPEYRLPDNCSPSNYKLHLSFPDTIFDGTTSTYEGNVVITFNCSTNTSNLRLHASKDYITINSLEVDGQKVDTGNYSIDQSIEQLKINTPWDIMAGNTSKLSIYFSGEVAERNVGLYRNSYEEHNESLYFVTTKFEPIYARTMFPCFDEPLFRATFDVSVTYPNRMKAYFNTEQIKSEGGLGNVTDTFMTTPSMSTYLLALMLSNFDRTTDSRYRIIARTSVLDDCLYARENGLSILAAYDKFTGFSYADMKTGKLDALIVPDYIIGGMEHWGMISFSEDMLLYNQEEDSILNEEEVFTVLVHEFAHQWFGDLVSIEWWSENYLKEGLAQYFQFFMTHQLHPEWELDKKFVLEMIHRSMQSDIIPAGRALNSEVSSPYEVSLKLGGLTYDKGATIFNMVKHIMGETNFKNGLRQYINQKKFKSVTATSLWDALDDHIFHDVSHLPSDLNNVMNNWVGLPGYPIIYVKRKGNDVILSQQRFLKNGEEDSSKWYVPITHTVSTEKNKFRTTTPDKWLTPNGDLLIPFADDWKWIILNTNATGYYRIDYEEPIWEGISEALAQNDFDGIPELNRVQIIDDLFSFAHMDKIPYSKVFRIIEFLSNDTSYYSWKTAFGHFERLQKLALSQAVRNAVMANLLHMSDKFYNTVPLTDIRDKDHMYLTKQLLAIEAACKMGKENCVSEMMTMFKNCIETKVRPDKNLKDLIYCNGIRYSNESKAWDFMWSIFKDAKTGKEKEMALTALGCGRDKYLLNMYLLKALEDKDVGNEDYEFLFGKSFKNNPENVDVALNILLENYRKIVVRYNGKSTWRSQILEVVDWLTTDDQIKKLEIFRNSGIISEVDMDIVTEAINRVKHKIKQSEKDNRDIEEYFGLSSGTIYLRCSIVFLVVCMIFVELL